MTKAQIIERYGIEAYEKHKERVKQYKLARKEANKDYSKDYNAKYYTENKKYYSDYHKKRYQVKKDEYAQYYRDNKDKYIERQREYDKTPKGRALNLVSGYRGADLKANRGECTLTSDWILNHIFNSKCVYCGETDWTKLGCDRIDNSKPHTEDNVVCCCGKCNRERNIKPFEEFMKNKNVKI